MSDEIKTFNKLNNHENILKYIESDIGNYKVGNGTKKEVFYIVTKLCKA